MEKTTAAAHRRVWDLIPWVLTGQAEASDAEFVHAHAAGCADCRDELAFHQALQAGMAADARPLPDPEPGLQRLLSRIDQAQEVAVPSMLPAWRQPAPRRRSWTRWLVAAVVVQGLGLAALAGLSLEHQRGAEYQTLSQPPVAAPASGGASIRLVVAGQLSMTELQALLEGLQLQLVETSPDGRLLGVAARADSLLRSDEAIQRLRAWPGVVLAEPMPTAGVARR